MLKSNKFYYVPLLETLKALVTHTEIQREIASPHHSTENQLADFCDGSLFKTHPLFSITEDALQIIGYFDELEVVNPLGSYTAK